VVDSQTVVIRPKFGAGLITLNFASHQAQMDFCVAIVKECRTPTESAIHDAATAPLPLNDAPANVDRDVFDVAYEEMLVAKIQRAAIDPRISNDTEETDDSFEDDYGVSQELW
jgi:hypothetical protein